MLNNVKYKSSSVENTKKIAAYFVKRFVDKYNKVIIFLEGDLGSGKTTFTRYALNALGISDNEFEGSPTFTIMNEYKNSIFHIDLYRLQSIEEIESTGILENLDKSGIFFIEWPELVYIKADMYVRFETTDDNERKISIDKC